MDLIDLSSSLNTNCFKLPLSALDVMEMLFKFVDVLLVNYWKFKSIYKCASNLVKKYAGMQAC